MTFPSVTTNDWRRLVDKELAGKAFDRVLVDAKLAGIPIAPLYSEAPVLEDAARFVRTEPFRICMRSEAGARVEDLVTEVASGADALWIPLELVETDAIAREELAGAAFVLECSSVPSPELALVVASVLPTPRFMLANDPIGRRARGEAPLATLNDDLAQLATLARGMRARGHEAPCALVSSVPYHDAGADPVDELAIALAVGVTYLEALVEGGLTPEEAGRAIGFRFAVGRDTFVEIAKLRALRTCWAKVLLASGASSARPLVHAVSSAQTLTVRDPWVNMLRVTTQVFAAVMGGAELVTPSAFDEAFGKSSSLGHRVARNTGLVLREESALGKVSDPVGGSYFFDSVTDAIARTGWTRFQEIVRDGGIVRALETKSLASHLEASWSARLERLATRKLPLLGVSEFAHLEEKLPHPAPRTSLEARQALPVHRDAEAFEALRLRADTLPAPEILLVTLGAFAESRPRVGFASTFFAAGGLKSCEGDGSLSAELVCVCGTDERYASEGETTVRAMKERGARHVLVAGRPGALEAPLRAAGADGFIYIGCDAVATLSDALSVLTAEVAS